MRVQSGYCFVWYLIFSAFTVQKSHSEAACNQTLTSQLRDDQFSASSYQYGNNASEARPGRAGWRAWSRYNGDHYLMIDLETIHEITAVDFTEIHNYYYTRSLRLLYSTDGHIWNAYNTYLSKTLFGEIFPRLDDTTNIQLNPSIVTRFLVLSVITWRSFPSLMIELYGCSRQELNNGSSFTNVSGNIEENTAWIPSQSPIVIDSSINIVYPALLTIHAGVSVVFTSEQASINVHGTLNVEGLEELEALFTSNYPIITGRSKWSGLVLEAGGNITLSHAVIRQATYGVRGATTSLRISHCHIFSCNAGIAVNSGLRNENDDLMHMESFLKNTHMTHNNNGLLLHGYDQYRFFYVKGSYFSDNSGNGIYITPWDDPNDEKLTSIVYIENSYFKNNKYGIYDRDGNYDLHKTHVNVNSCTFNGNSKYAYYMYRWFPNRGTTVLDQVMISNSRFTGSSERGISAYCVYCVTTTFLFENNYFEDLVVSIYIDFDLYRNYQILLAASNNTMNRSSDYAIAIEVSSGQIDIDKNHFSNTEAGVIVTGKGYMNLSGNAFTEIYGTPKSAVYVENIPTVITHNVFSDCSIRTLINLHDSYHHVITNNSFVNNTATHCLIKTEELYDRYNTIIVDGNYWGTDNIDVIKSMLCDVFLDSTKARMEFTSFYTDFEMSVLKKHTDVNSFTYIYSEDLTAFIVGGVLNSTEDLPIFSNNRLIVNRSIVVEEGAVLSLNSAILNFTSNRGVVVLGDIRIEGSEEMPSVLQANQYSQIWNGLQIYSNELTLSNMKALGATPLLYIRTECVVNITNAFFQGKSLVRTSPYHANLTLIIAHTSVETEVASVFLSMEYLKSITIDFSVSSFRSLGTVLAIDESWLRRADRNNENSVALRVRNCNITSGYHAFFARCCSGPIRADVYGNNMDVKYRALYFSSSTVHAQIESNDFVQSEYSFFMEFCYSIRDTEGIPHLINITRNQFMTKGNGADINIQGRDYRTSPRHRFEIDENNFVHDLNKGRKGISIDLDKRYHQHIISINFNTFSQIAGSAVLSKCKQNELIISSNFFLNNTGSVLAFDSPMTSLHHNVFENTEADYNIEILPGNYEEDEINATLNYWGTTDVNEIALQIFDKNFEDTLMDVIYRPYLGSWDITDVQDAEVPFVGASGEIGGRVKGTITLDAESSPYMVTSNIEVEEGAVLQLEAGITLEFQQSIGIDVYGVLNVSGSPNSIVTMTAKVPSEKWRSISIKSVSRGSSIQHLLVNDTSDGIHIGGRTILLHNITSQHSEMNGITIDVQGNISFPSQLQASHNKESGIVLRLGEQHGGGDDSSTESTNILGFHIDSCLVYNNKNGLYISADSNVSFSNCFIHNNNIAGVHVDQRGAGTVALRQSRLESNERHATYIVTTTSLVLNSCFVTNHNNGYLRYGRWRVTSLFNMQHGAQDLFEFRLTNNVFSRNTGNGIQLEYNDYDKGILELHLENNTFSDNTIAIQLINSRYRWRRDAFWQNVSIYGNVFESNTHAAAALIELQLDSVGLIDIESNSFVNNSMTELLLFAGALQQRSLGTIRMQRNEFRLNKASNGIINMQNYDDLYLQYNVFEDNDTPCSLIAPSFDVTYHIKAMQNYWGTSDLRSVINTVCSFESDMEKSFVYYLPYYEDSTLTTLITYFQSDIKVNSVYGGEVNTDKAFELQEDGSELVISRSLLIRNGSTLTIDAGMTLLFESKRGILVQGVLSVTGSKQHVTMTAAMRDFPWYGIRVNSTEISTLSNIKMSNTMVGLVTLTSTLEMREIEITNSSAYCLIIDMDENSQFLSKNHLILNKIWIENCGEGAISIHGDGDVILRELFITNVSNAVEINVGENNDQAGNLTMEKCIMKDCESGLLYSSENSVAHTVIRVYNNTFMNIKQEALIMSTSDEGRNVGDETIDTGSNLFENACGVELYWHNNMDLVVHDNIFKNNYCSELEDCHFTIAATSSYERQTGRYCDINTNVFQNIFSQCVVKLASQYDDFKGMFRFNHLLLNLVLEGVLILESSSFLLTQNLFDNRNSIHDVYVHKTGNASVNATQNWWGSDDVTAAYNRVFDKRRDPDLLLLNIEPILTESNFDCSSVNNCSQRGDCVSPNRCRCYSGWTGTTCSEFDCGGVNYCSQNGLCTGPNLCECFQGWSGPQCTDASCVNVRNCSSHGLCVRPDVCICVDRFTGVDCSSCIDLHWGPECEPCPACQYGTCNIQTGACVCEGENWTGALCDECSEAYYGDNCQPLMTILSIVPDQGLDTGGNLVHVWGHNFPHAPSPSTSASVDGYSCRFGTEVSNGTWLAWDHVVCQAPRHPEGAVTLEVSHDGQEYTDNRLQYTFYSTCLADACGRANEPPRGQCLFGDCSCHSPWTGSQCTVELLAPIILTPDDITLTEGSYFSYQMSLTQGSLPVTWALLSSPEGLSVEEGLIKWITTGSSRSHDITVVAANSIGQHEVTWRIQVPFSYSVNIRSIGPNGVLAVPRNVQVSGEVISEGDTEPRAVAVAVRVTSMKTGKETLISSTANLRNSSEFSVVYNPRPDDVGDFNVTAYHPGSDPNTASYLVWSVMGMKCEPVVTRVEEYIKDNVTILQNIGTLYNTGGHDIYNISVRIDGLPYSYVTFHGNQSEEHGKSFLHELDADSRVPFDLVIENVRPVYGTIYVIMTSLEGTAAYIQVNIRLSIEASELVFSPRSIRQTVVRGAQRIIDIHVTNEGGASARSVQVNLPNDDRLSLVSFTIVPSGETNSDDVITPGGTAVLSLALTIEPEESLGEMVGRIAINTELRSFFLPYTFFITSLDVLNLTVTVEDEFTYFAQGAPLVIGAEVRLVNPRRRYSETRFTTNETGFVVFENVFEDKYSLYVDEENHTSYTAVIIASSHNDHIQVFLQRVAVKYTWTVTPTVIEDRYVVTLDSTYETFVPMPVVTIQPAKVNTVPYEEGRQDIIEFTITNHGLIRADNLRFVLPNNHQFLNFESTIDVIGNLEANTTIVVPVMTSLKPRVKRSSRGGCSMSLLYSYVCGTRRTQSAGVSLTREYPGSPPLPCGELYPSAISARGGRCCAGGGYIRYRAVTPVTCDCPLALIRKCVLPYLPKIPQLGCAGGAPASLLASGGSGLAVAGSVLSTLVSCALSHCPHPYCRAGKVAFDIFKDLKKLLGCAKAINDNCLPKRGGRRRREISSEVVENLIQASQRLDNFFKMSDEVLGDDDMYELNETWYAAFTVSVADGSELESRLSEDEQSYVLESINDEKSRLVLSRFLQRWNETASAWNNGTINELVESGLVMNLAQISSRVDTYIEDNAVATGNGFQSIFDEFDHAVDIYDEAEKESQTGSGKSQDGICARVRVRIVQEFTLTREAFTARLEIENGENSALEDIHVEFRIRETYGSSLFVNDRFAIGDADLQGLSAVDGTGELGPAQSGAAEWLLIPYSIAAPKVDTLYDVGGILSYSVDGSEFSVPLVPDVITVKPNPSLIVNYFHEKHVQGDDALTPQKEPIIPFSLAVMVTNNGFGVARDLKITSAQPEIIENEKGLLVTFQIIGAQLGFDDITPSLTVDFGDIDSFETKTARWLMTSSLMGKFYNFSATFENINPLGDPQLSLLDEVGYHELIHLVRIEHGEHTDDGLDDFLVNDRVDNKAMPDKLYDSANGTQVYDVIIANLTLLSHVETSDSEGKKYVTVNITVNTFTNTWFYMRIINNITSFDDNNNKLQHAQSQNRKLLVDKNVWQTTHIMDEFFIHILDFIETDINNTVPTEVQYSLIFGPHNNGPQFNSTTYVGKILSSALLDEYVMTIEAYDPDNDAILYEIDALYSIPFRIDSSNGRIYVNEIPLIPDDVIFEVIVRDVAFVSASASAMVTITIISETSQATPFTSQTDAMTTTMAIASQTTQPTRIPIDTSRAMPVTSHSDQDTLQSTSMTNQSEYSTTASPPSMPTEHFVSVTRQDEPVTEATTSRLILSTSATEDDDVFRIKLTIRAPLNMWLELRDLLIRTLALLINKRCRLNVELCCPGAVVTTSFGERSFVETSQISIGVEPQAAVLNGVEHIVVGIDANLMANNELCTYAYGGSRRKRQASDEVLGDNDMTLNNSTADAFDASVLLQIITEAQNEINSELEECCNVTIVSVSVVELEPTTPIILNDATTTEAEDDSELKGISRTLRGVIIGVCVVFAVIIVGVIAVVCARRRMNRENNNINNNNNMNQPSDGSFHGSDNVYPRINNETFSSGQKRHSTPDSQLQ